MTPNVLRGLAITIALLLGGGAVAAGVVERPEAAATGIDGSHDDDPYGPDHTRQTYITWCNGFLAAEVDDLIATKGDWRTIQTKRGDNFFPIVSETYRQYVGEAGWRMTTDAALDRGVDRIKAWCIADADKS